MAASQDHILASKLMGATPTGGGATFRVWAPGALHVYVTFDDGGHAPSPSDELVKDPTTSHWTGFFPGVLDGAKYRYRVEGPRGKGLKRDPWARELEFGDFRDTGTRWRGGRVSVWLAARRETGWGEGSSGLAFDQIVPQHRTLKGA